MNILTFTNEKEEKIYVNQDDIAVPMVQLRIEEHLRNVLNEEDRKPIVETEEEFSKHFENGKSK